MLFDRLMVAPLNRLVLSIALALTTSWAATALPTIRFDEPEFVPAGPVDGLIIDSLYGVPIPALRFGFDNAAASGADARIGGGPGLSDFVSEPGIEGPSSGDLEVHWQQPISFVAFSVALSHRFGENDAIRLHGVTPSGESVSASFSTVAPDGGFAGTHVLWAPPFPVETLSVGFETNAARFLLDNLYLQTETGPEPPVSAPLHSGVISEVRYESEASLLIWQERVLPNRSELWLSHWTPPAQVLSQPQRVALLADTEASPAQVASVATAAGTWIVWTAPGAGLTRFVIADAVSTSPPRVLLPFETPDLQLLSSEGAVRAIWRQSSGLRSRSFSPTGEPQDQGIALTPPRPGETEFQARSLGRFGFVIAETLAARNGIRLTWFDPRGEQRAENLVLAEDPSHQVSNVRLDATAATGMAVLTWVNDAPTSATDPLWAQRYFPSGRARGAPVLVEGRRAPRDVDLALNEDGDFVVAWISENSGSAVGQQESLQGRLYAADGRPSTPVSSEIAGPRGGFFELAAPQVTLSNADIATVHFLEGPADGTRDLHSLSQIHDLDAPASCVLSATQLCLRDGRFAVTAEFTNRSGTVQSARTAPWSDDSGMFWFFDDENIEIVIKVLDGRDINDNFWVFYAALSNVAFDLHVADTLTGASRTWHNPRGRFASVGDTQALPSLEGAVLEPFAARSHRASPSTSVPSEDWIAAAATSARAQTISDPTELLLFDGRFSLRVRLVEPGPPRYANANDISRDTGAFWFFEESNIELVVKVLDGRSVNRHFWVFYGSLSNVGFELEVTDLETGERAVYVNEFGRFASFGDTEALPAANAAAFKGR